MGQRQQPRVVFGAEDVDQAPIVFGADDVDAAAPPARQPARAEDFIPAGPQGSALERFASNAGAALNPITMVTGLAHALANPQETVRNIYAAGAAEAGKAADAYQQGRYSEMIGHGMAAALPIIGPAAAAAGEQIAGGDVAGGLGAGTGLVGSIFAPSAITKGVKGIPIVPRVGKSVPASVAEAVQFGLREGIPVDVATATQNPFIRAGQTVAEESLLGSTLVSPGARAAQNEALTAASTRLAQRASPAAVVPEQAGQALRDRLDGLAAAHTAAADAAYTKLRAIEAKQARPVVTGPGATVTSPVVGPSGQPITTTLPPPTRTMLAVDVAPTKAALRPIYDALVEEHATVPFIGGSQKGKALVALSTLMKAPDLAPLSVADSALGELKGFARVDQAFRRTAGQGIAAEAVTHLEQAVRATALQAGPDAFQALMDGRAATVNKFKTIELLDKLHVEPVKVFKQATWADDTGIAQLRNLARVAPTEVRQIGRAWLHDAFSTAGPEGWLSGAKGRWNDWQNLGPETKRLLFRDAAHIKDLDHFFLLAKKMAENPNPSGSAKLALKGGELTALYASPVGGVLYTLGAPLVAKLLLSPRGTRLLLQGLRLPVGATAARSLWAGELGRLLQEQAPALTPATAGDGQAPP